MSRRIGHFSEVKLFSRHVKDALAYPGFGVKTSIKEQLDRNEMKCATFNPAASNLGVYGTEGWTVAYLRLGANYAAAMAKPLADLYSAQSLDATYYSFSAGQWDDITGAEYADHIMYQGDSEPAIRGLRTNWKFGTNPVIAVSLWRGEANRAWLAAGDQDAYTYATWVRFGGAYGDAFGDKGQFSIKLPYGGNQGIELYAWNPWRAEWGEPLPLVEGSQPLQAPQGMPPGQRWWLWIASIRGAIWLSTDGFLGQAAGYWMPERMRDASDAWQDVPHGANVQTGPVWITHTAGSFAATVYPVWMPNTAAGCTPYLWGNQARAFYRIADNPQTVNYQAWTDRVIDDAGTVLNDVTVTVQSLGDYTRVARVTLDPTAWSLKCSDYSGTAPKCFTSPALFGVQVSQQPYLVSTGQSGASTVYTTRADIELSWKDLGRPASGRIVLHNPHGVASGVQDYQRVQVRLGEKMDDGTTTSAVVYTGYVVTPGDRQSPGSVNRLELRTFDAMTRLDDLKAVGDEPDFAVFKPDDGLKFLLARALVPSATISGAGTSAIIAATEFAPEADTWRMQLGRPYGEMAQKLLTIGADTLTEPDRGGALYLRYSAAPGWETWIRSSGPFTTTGVSWTLTERSPSDYASSLYHIYSLERQRHGANAPEYANYIEVVGEDQTTRAPLHGSWFDISSVSPSAATFGGGWIHSYVERDQSLRTVAAAQKRTAVLASQIGVPREYVTVQTDLLPTVTYGQVFQLSGTATGRVAQASVNGTKYRVEQYQHTLRVGAMARTTLTGRRLPD